jgi:hypothetical protein
MSRANSGIKVEASTQRRALLPKVLPLLRSLLAELRLCSAGPRDVELLRLSVLLGRELSLAALELGREGVL